MMNTRTTLCNVSQADAGRLEHAIVQHAGEVERAQGSALVVSSAAGVQHARLAASCLLQPQVGDVVLVATHADQPYVLAVLQRASATPAVLHIDGDAQLSASGRLQLQAESVEIATERLSVWSRAAHWLADVFDLTAERLRQSGGLVSLHAKAYQRTVEDMEIARAGHMDLGAKELLNVHARHTMMKSEELVKIDGKQIQVG
jgi:hypothetical protein